MSNVDSTPSGRIASAIRRTGSHTSRRPPWPWPPPPLPPPFPTGTGGWGPAPQGDGFTEFGIGPEPGYPLSELNCHPGKNRIPAVGRRRDRERMLQDGKFILVSLQKRPVIAIHVDPHFEGAQHALRPTVLLAMAAEHLAMLDPGRQPHRDQARQRPAPHRGRQRQEGDIPEGRAAEGIGVNRLPVRRVGRRIERQHGRGRDPRQVISTLLPRGIVSHQRTRASLPSPLRTKARIATLPQAWRNFIANPVRKAASPKTGPEQNSADPGGEPQQ